jgi:hypothetical protein
MNIDLQMQMVALSNQNASANTEPRMRTSGMPRFLEEFVKMI